MSMVMPRVVSLTVRPRSPALAPFVGSIGYHAGDAGPHRLERSVPTGIMSLMVNLHEDEIRTYGGSGHQTVQRVRGAVLAGPRAGPAVIDTAEQRRIVTVTFAPGGAAPFFPAPPAATRDQIVELEALWGRGGAVLRERLLEAATPAEVLHTVETALLEHVAGPLEPDRAVASAVGALERDVPVAAVADSLGLLPKRFARRFRGQVGLSPKRYARVRRLQRLLREVHGNGPVDWALVAARHGWYDQAHLIHDFRDLTGVTPTAYLAAVDGHPNHVPLADADR